MVKPKSPFGSSTSWQLRKSTASRKYASASSSRPCHSQQDGGLTKQVEGDVGERDVLLEDGAVPTPFAQAMTEDEPVVAEALEVLEQCVRLRRGCRHDRRSGRRHRPRTPRGTL